MRGGGGALEARGVAPTLAGPEAVHLESYADGVLERFTNTALGYRAALSADTPISAAGSRPALVLCVEQEGDTRSWFQSL